MFKKIHKISAGFSILEMLVALLVLSIGLLGVATLQIRGQQFNQVGYLRTQATFLAYDIMDRMRINLDHTKAGGYAYPASGTTNVGPSGSKDPNTSCDMDTGSCSVQELKTYDLDNWFNLVRETLPEGNATIKSTDADTDEVFEEHTITIQWANIIDRDDDAEKEEQEWKLQL
ncbi:MAG: type IV pilus modification protein PilV [Candidatus Parabeggiatoa sp. nov. 2]|nr:MAG: type IV pilus modification protein PilV [Beggiatoa sp. 4572_84]RKZ60717.1 MAG: type IV pilus modification protein PilV [Gammaproteobacteria bacterium]HEC84846.1 type IV pilus modification protein PilV [Thioploca sp.]